MQEEIRTLDFPDRERFVRAYEEGSGRSARGGRGRPSSSSSRREPQALNGRTFRVGWPVIGAATSESGARPIELMRRLFPLCRSLTGTGCGHVRLLEEHVPLARTEIPSGTEVFDWTVPDEWNIRDAYIAAPGRHARGRLPRAPRCTSSPTASRCATRLPLEALRERLHTLPDQPDLIPYRTSYYDRTWGFCLSHRRLLELEPGDYEVVIDSTLEPGHLTYAELPGRGRRTRRRC